MTAQRPKVSFEANVPVELAIHWAEGKIVAGRFGDQVMYSCDCPADSVMFLDMAVSQKINMLEIQPGERFFVCKRPKNGSVPARWDVWLSPATEKLRAMKESPGGAWTSPVLPAAQRQQIDGSIRQVQERKAAAIADRPAAAAVATQPVPQPQGTGTYGPVAVPQRLAAPPEKATYQAAMREFLLIAGRAAKQAETTLGAEGGSVRFDNHDVAALATAMLHHAAREGCLSWRPGEGK